MLLLYIIGFLIVACILLLIISSSSVSECCIKENVRLIGSKESITGFSYRVYRCDICKKKKVIYPFYGDPYV